MRLGDKIPVPELPAARAARVQQRVLSSIATAPERRRSWLAPAIAAAAIAAAVAIALVLDAPAMIESRSAVLGGRDVVVTELASAGDAVTVRLDGATITLAPETRAALLRSREGIEVALERGRVDCEVEPAPHRSRPALVVGTGDVEVEVVGTVFAVERGEAVRVEVSRGKVRVRSRSGSVIVVAGRAWSEAEGVVSLVAAAERDRVRGEPTARPGAEIDRARDERHETRRQSRRSDAGKKDNKRSVGAADRRRARPPRHRVPGGNPELLAAMDLESGDPRAAVQAFTRIAAASRGATASFALYSKAYVEYFDLGARAAAVETLELFGRRFPRAREAQSAAWLRVLALCDLGRAGECRAAAYSYIRRFPRGEFVGAASAVVNR